MEYQEDSEMTIEEEVKQPSQENQKTEQAVRREAQTKMTLTEKKYATVMDNTAFFTDSIQKFKDGLHDEKVDNSEEIKLKIAEGRDISICVRARPLLEHEINQECFDITHAKHKDFYFFEPKVDVRGRPQFQKEAHDVDHAFGPDSDNQMVYEAIINPLMDLSLKGGCSSIFTYGQTGSGKTFTIQGIQQKLAQDLFKGDISSNYKILVSFFQLVGNVSTDLLDNKKQFMIGEDHLGRVQYKDLKEMEITSSEQFLECNSLAATNRETVATFKNETSSRSHAVCRIRFVNKKLEMVEVGEFMLFDLAGSENTSDSKFHDKEMQKQSKEINKSLMNLKECIRNRALQAMNPEQKYHIPYRGSKLTLLLKNSFELTSKIHCKTVVFANVSSAVIDHVQTKNTLRYVTPIKIGAKEKVKNKNSQPDEKVPASWDNQMLVDFLNKFSNNRIDTSKFCPWERGLDILSIPQQEFIQRLLDQNFSEKQALQVYIKIWGLNVDARTAIYKTKEKAHNKKIAQDRKEVHEEIQQIVNDDLHQDELLRQQEAAILVPKGKNPHRQ